MVTMGRCGDYAREFHESQGARRSADWVVVRRRIRRVPEMARSLAYSEATGQYNCQSGEHRGTERGGRFWQCWHFACHYDKWPSLSRIVAIYLRESSSSQTAVRDFRKNT